MEAVAFPAFLECERFAQEAGSAPSHLVAQLAEALLDAAAGFVFAEGMRDADGDGA
jgi:hypothetical protein